MTEKSNEPDQDGSDGDMNEEKFIAGYRELTGASESEARSAYMFAEAARRENTQHWNGKAGEPGNSIKNAKLKS